MTGPGVATIRGAELLRGHPMTHMSPLIWWICAAVIGYFALYVLLVWLRGLEERPPIERELYKASHGVGIIVCGAYLIHAVPTWQRHWLAVGVVYGCVCFLGIFWFLVGSSRAQIYGDARLRSRSVVKFGMGWVFLGVWHYFLPRMDWELRGSPSTEIVSDQSQEGTCRRIVWLAAFFKPGGSLQENPG